MQQVRICFASIYHRRQIVALGALEYINKAKMFGIMAMRF